MVSQLPLPAFRSPDLGVFTFVADRLRALRQDAVRVGLPHTNPEDWARLLLFSERFHVIAGGLFPEPAYEPRPHGRSEMAAASVYSPSLNRLFQETCLAQLLTVARTQLQKQQDPTENARHANAWWESALLEAVCLICLKSLGASGTASPPFLDAPAFLDAWTATGEHTQEDFHHHSIGTRQQLSVCWDIRAAAASGRIGTVSTLATKLHPLFQICLTVDAMDTLRLDFMATLVSAACPKPLAVATPRLTRLLGLQTDAQTVSFLKWASTGDTATTILGDKPENAIHLSSRLQVHATGRAEPHGRCFGARFLGMPLADASHALCRTLFSSAGSDVLT